VGLERGNAGQQMLQRSTTVSFWTGVGVIAGFVVDVLLVARFGIGAETDAFFAGYTMPFILVTRLAAIQPVVVSVLAGYRQQPTAFAVLLNAAGLLAAALAGLGALLARPLVALTAPGFEPATAALAARLAAILFARVPLAAVAEVCRAELYARRRFGLATFASAVPSLVAASVLLAGSGSGIQLVAWSFVAGALVQALLLAGVLFGALHAPYRLTLRHPEPVLRNTGRMVLAPLIGLFLRQGVTLAERVLGSYLPAGSVTALSYANRLNTIVAGVFFDGVTTASLPVLTERWRNGPLPAARTELRMLLKLAITVAVPIGLAVAALSTPLARLFFERGQVQAEAALLLGTILGVYSLSLPFLGPFRAVQTFFYAIQETWPVVILHGGLALLAVALDLALVQSLGAVGLALAYAASCGIMAFAGLAWVARRAGPIGWRSLAVSTGRLVVVAAAAAASAWAISQWLGAAAAGASQGERLLSLAAGGLAGLFVFAGLGAILKVEAVTIVVNMVKAR
jgi:putative peptidoglycan lipid II flippase